MFCAWLRLPAPGAATANFAAVALWGVRSSVPCILLHTSPPPPPAPPPPRLTVGFPAAAAAVTSGVLSHTFRSCSMLCIMSACCKMCDYLFLLCWSWYGKVLNRDVNGAPKVAQKGGPKSWKTPVCPAAVSLA